MRRSRPQPLAITADAYDAMIAHCAKGSSVVSFGLLAGIPPRTEMVFPLVNAARNRGRYATDPRDFGRAVVELRQRGLAMTAIYYSCRGHAAVPTPTDLRDNLYGDLPRVIVSIGEVPKVRVWRLAERYCEELDWQLLPNEEGAEMEKGLYRVMRAQVRRTDGNVRQPQLLESVLSAFFWWSPRNRISIQDLHNFLPLEPEPMWDPTLDLPEE